MPDRKTIGELAYDAYRDHTSGLTWNGYPMPLWADLTPTIHGAWEDAAAAVRRTTLQNVVDMLRQTREDELTERAALIEGAAL